MLAFPSQCVGFDQRQHTGKHSPSEFAGLNHADFALLQFFENDLQT